MAAATMKPGSGWFRCTAAWRTGGGHRVSDFRVKADRQRAQDFEISSKQKLFWNISILIVSRPAVSSQQSAVSTLLAQSIGHRALSVSYSPLFNKLEPQVAGCQ